MQLEFGKTEAQRCVHGQPAFCTAACPFDLNVRDFLTRLGRGRTDAAYRIFRDAVAFPFIVSELCTAPCQNACIRTKTDDAIQLHALEQAVCTHARNIKPTRFNVPKKQGRVAVIGAGISGLACALRLGMMNYDVTVYEKSDRIGGHLNGLLSKEILEKDFQTQFQSIEYTLSLNYEVKTLDLFADVIYVATGRGGEDFGLLPARSSSLIKVCENILLGGSMVGADSMNALAHGLLAAQAIDTFFKTGTLKAPQSKESCTSLCFDESRLLKTPMIVPESDAYTEKEMAQEAQRCLKCDCDICQKTCDLMGFYEKYPGRIVDEVEITVVPSVMFGHRLATRLIGSCTQCGICKETCPKHIDMQTFLLESRREMERLGDMPKVWSAFWLQDMTHANGERAALSLMSKGYEKVRHAFFPGCQLGASDARYVQKTYEALLEEHPDTGLMLGCCGAPAYWAGQEDLHQKTLEQIRNNWISMGKPTILLACPTCYKFLCKYLPEMQYEFVYPFLLEKAKERDGKETVSVFDPCSSRHEGKVQDAVRELLIKCGHTLSALAYERENAQCCGYGGQTMLANPRMAEKMVTDRIAQSEYPYVTYCTNCRDTFSAKGKQAMHVLDIVFDLDDGTRQPPTWTKRRENREELKQAMLAFFEEKPMDLGQAPLNVIISDELMRKIQKDYILKEDIEQAIAHCERTDSKILDPKTGHFMGHLRIGYMTFWVEYAIHEDGVVLHNAYAHRMQIQED